LHNIENSEYDSQEMCTKLEWSWRTMNKTGTTQHSTANDIKLHKLEQRERWVIADQVKSWDSQTVQE